MPNIELIIFDFDGVIADSEHLYSKAEKMSFDLAGIDISIEDIGNRFLGMAETEIYKILTAEYGAERTQVYIDNSSKFIHQIISNELTSVPHVVDFIENTHLPYCVASNAHTDWTTEKINFMNIQHLFGDILLGTNSVDNPKPAPDMFKLAADKAGIAYDKCVVIEDGIYGIQAAKSLGMKPIGFTGQTLKLDNHHQRLTNAGAILTFDDMRKLPNIIAEL